MRKRLAVYGVVLVGLGVVAFLASSSSSSPPAKASGSKAQFCAAADAVAAENVGPVAPSFTPAEARDRLARQLAAVAAVATASERAGWATERPPLTRAAVQRLAQALTRDCQLSIDIFGINATKTG